MAPYSKNKAPSPTVHALCELLALHPQKVITHRAGVNWQTISNLRSGTRQYNPGIMILERLGDAIGYELVWKRKDTE